MQEDRDEKSQGSEEERKEDENEEDWPEREADLTPPDSHGPVLYLHLHAHSIVITGSFLAIPKPF